MRRGELVVWSALVLGLGGLTLGVLARMPSTAVGGLLLVVVALSCAIASYRQRGDYRAECGRCSWRIGDLATLEAAAGALTVHAVTEHPEHAVHIAGKVTA